MPVEIVGGRRSVTVQDTLGDRACGGAIEGLGIEFGAQEPVLVRIIGLVPAVAPQELYSGGDPGVVVRGRASARRVELAAQITVLLDHQEGVVREREPKVTQGLSEGPFRGKGPRFGDLHCSPPTWRI